MIDWLSFVTGAALGAVGAFGTGFLQKAGEAAFAGLKGRLGPPAPVKVATTFLATIFAPGDCAWVDAMEIDDREAAGWSFYPAPPRNAKCYRVVAKGGGQADEYLMVRPGAIRA